MADIDVSNVMVTDNGDNGILTLTGNVDLQSSVVDDNGGGGIETGSGNVTLTRSTVSNNDGNGIETGNGDVTTTNSTISGNSSDGIETDDGDIELYWSTIAENGGYGVRVTESGVIYLEGTIVANNDDDDCSDEVEDSEYSLDSDGSCGLTGEGDISDGFADLGPLQDNGGTTETHALGSESDAIDGGGNGCPEDDQRSFNRYQGDACDIGAYESGGEQNTPGPTSTPGSSRPRRRPQGARRPTRRQRPARRRRPIRLRRRRARIRRRLLSRGEIAQGWCAARILAAAPTEARRPSACSFGAAMLAVMAGVSALAMGRRMRS